MEQSVLDFITQVIPAAWLPYFFVAWVVAFYVVGPLIKRFGSPGTLIVKAAEWLTQDTHRPPAKPPEKKIPELKPVP